MSEIVVFILQRWCCCVVVVCSVCRGHLVRERVLLIVRHRFNRHALCTIAAWQPLRLEPPRGHQCRSFQEVIRVLGLPWHRQGKLESTEENRTCEVPVDMGRAEGNAENESSPLWSHCDSGAADDRAPSEERLHATAAWT